MAQYTANENLYKWSTSDTKQTTITETALNADKIDVKLNDHTTQLTSTSTEIGVKSTLPLWLQNSIRDVSKLHDDYLRQFAVNVRLPPYNAGGGGDDYDKIIQALTDMNYTGVLYMPGIYNISKPIHLGKRVDDVVDGSQFLVQNLRIIGDPKTAITKTTSALDISGKDSIFYTNSINTHFSNLSLFGLGFNSECIGFNLRSFHTFSSIRNIKVNSVKTAFYLDAVYIVDIIECHVGGSKEVFDCSSYEKTSITLDKIWGENIWRFGSFKNINYSKFGTLLCDWVNVPAPDNQYTVPVTFVDYPTAIFEFSLCTSVTIDVLASENSRALTFIFYGASSLNISYLHIVALKNNSGTTINNNGTYTPAIALSVNDGVKKTTINTIHIDALSTVNLIAWYPYASNTYGSKFVPYLTMDNIPENITPVDCLVPTSNIDIMVKHPKSKYPIYWDKPIPDATAKPFCLKVDTAGTLTTEAITYYYYA